MARLRRSLLGQLAAAGAAVAAVVWLVRHYPIIEYVGVAQQWIASLGSWGVLLYPLLYGLCNVLLLPGGSLAIGSGLFFGLWWGFLLNVVGSALGAAVSFALSRWALRGWVRGRLLRHPRGPALDAAVAREGWKIVFLTQLHPLAPSSLLNYLYGVTGIPFSTCLLGVALGQVPGAFLYAYLGTVAQLGLRVRGGAVQLGYWDYLLWSGGLLAAALLTFCLGRVAFRILALAEAHSSAGPNQPRVTGELVRRENAN